MPEAAFTHQTTAPAPPAVVWTRLQDPSVWAAVAGADSTSEHLYDGPALAGFRFSASIAGIAYRGDARVTVARAEEIMELAIRSAELTGEITVGLEGDGSGTRLAVGMCMRPAGILGSMIFPVVTGAVSSGFEESVERLAAAMG